MINKNLLKFAALIAASSTSTAFGFKTPTFAAQIQWTIEDGGNGNFYEAILRPDGISWHDAKAEAEAAGGHLVTITSAAENDFVSSLFSGNPNFWINVGLDTRGPWIGGFQPVGSPEPAGGFSWVTGESFTFTKWAISSNGTAQQPANDPLGEDFIHYIGPGNNNFTSDAWNDLLPDNPPSNPVSYIVEVEAEPESVPEPSNLLGLGAFAILGLLILQKPKDQPTAKTVKVNR